ncbi:carboxypeptidase-like regulatory domain-containing protein, partial [bacterium]|nr:carboxypeptidase-like regulatory domain-containing protein [bacterium]
MRKYIILVIGLLLIIGLYWLTNQTPETEVAVNNASLFDEIPTTTPTPLRGAMQPTPHVASEPQSASAESIVSASEDATVGLASGPGPAGGGAFGPGYVEMGNDGEPVIDIRKNVVTCSVISFKNDSPIENAAVYVGEDEICRTDVNGRFHWKCQGRESLEVIVKHPDYHAVSQTISGKSFGAVYIRMIPVGALVGYVLDNAKHGIPFAKVTLETPNKLFRKSVFANPFAFFLFENLPEGNIRLLAERIDYQDKGEGHLELEPPFDRVVKLYLEQGLYSISGRVLRSDTKEPEEHAQVSLQFASSGDCPGTGTNKNGEFEFKNVRPGMYYLYAGASWNGYGRDPDFSKQMVQVLDKDIEGLEVLISPLSSLDVTVQTKDGKPVEGAFVYGISSPGQKEPFQTDGQGRFT